VFSDEFTSPVTTREDDTAFAPRVEADRRGSFRDAVFDVDVPAMLLPKNDFRNGSPNPGAISLLPALERANSIFSCALCTKERRRSRRYSEDEDEEAGSSDVECKLRVSRLPPPRPPTLPRRSEMYSRRVMNLRVTLRRAKACVIAMFREDSGAAVNDNVVG
jgi:hypothetical protein